jgi:hypothetical protein
VYVGPPLQEVYFHEEGNDVSPTEVADCFFDSAGLNFRQDVLEDYFKRPENLGFNPIQLQLNKTTVENHIRRINLDIRCLFERTLQEKRLTFCEPECFYLQNSTPFTSFLTTPVNILQFCIVFGLIRGSINGREILPVFINPIRLFGFQLEPPMGDSAVTELMLELNVKPPRVVEHDLNIYTWFPEGPGAWIAVRARANSDPGVRAVP